MAIFKFTEARIRDLALGSGIHRDTEVKGLMCIAHKTTKSFCVQGDVRRDKRLVRSVRVKIGRVDLVRLAEARNEARKLMATIQSGIDPTAGPESTGITLEKALEEHLGERDLSAATVRNYQYHMDNYLGRAGGHHLRRHGSRQAGSGLGLTASALRRTDPRWSTCQPRRGIVHKE